MRHVLVSRRVWIAALVLPALVLVAVAARSYQPFGGEGGERRSPSAAVFDGAFTVMLVLGGLGALLAIWALLYIRRRRGRDNQPPFASLAALLAIVVAGVVAGTVFENKRHGGASGGSDLVFPERVVPERPRPQLESERSPEIVWPLAIGLAALIVAAVVAAVIVDRWRDRRGRQRSDPLEQLGRALDEAIDDLRRDPDPRRAVIAAYARMEQALTVYGFPRRPSEAPYEYLHRVARELEAEGPVAALTELFEVAKFSEHSVDETMRGRAIDALTAVRAEVRTAAT